MYQLGWATVPRYLIKHYSECFCEDVLDEINFGISRISKQIVFPNVDGPHPIS